MTENISRGQVLRELKIEFAVKQKKGLPFIMASAVLWTIMLIAFLTGLNLYYKNIIAMCCSALLMPVGMLCGKIIKVNIFSKENPLSGLSIVAALNQLLYLPIVLWVMYAAIVIPIASLIFGIYFGQVIVCLAFVAFDVLICILLTLENKQAAKWLEEIEKTKQNT